MVKLKNKNELKKNIRFVCLFFIVTFAVIAVRAYFLGVLNAEELSKRIRKQHRCQIELTPHRGTIYDRNHAELAVSIEVSSLFARPALITNKRSAAKKIARVLGLHEKKILKKLNTKKNFVWIKRKLAPKQVKKIGALNIHGLDFVKEPQRFYPNRELAGQVIGFAGIDSQGLEGLECNYDDVLKGHPRKLIVERDALGRHLFTDGLKISESEEGQDIVLSLD